MSIPRTEGYEVDLDKFREMHETVSKLLDETFGVDCDGDSSVEFRLIDRQRTHMPHCLPLPYVRDYTLEQIDAFLERAMSNLSAAVHEVDTMMNVRRSVVREMAKE